MRYSFRAVMLGALVFSTSLLAKRPNVVVILADDMGVDSVSALNEKMGIETPHLNGLVAEGMSFGDAHSGSAVCTPTRYGVLTGRYSWRSRLKGGIVQKWERPLIEEGRMTLPSMLKENGYATACIGKWHLGWNWPKKGGGVTEREAQIDFTGEVKGGALGCGFDAYFGDDVPNWPPFVWIENGQMLGVPDTKLKFAKHYHSNDGIGVKDWELEAVLPKITQRSVKYIEEHAKGEKPFFLYFAMTSPHTPIAPSAQFKGKSGVSDYADFLLETDWSVGQVMDALKRNGIEGETLVVFTTDNGTSPKADFARLKKSGIELQEHWRGTKADAFEGGHRVPFIVRFPGLIAAGSKSDEMISLVDIMATCADLLGIKLPGNAGEDSVSLLPVLKGEKLEAPLREAVICHSSTGQFVVRQGKWKVLFCPGSGGWSKPNDAVARKRGLPEWQVYDLKADPKESKNLIKEKGEVAEGARDLLRRYVERGRSTPGVPQKNHGGVNWWKQLPWEKP